MFLINVKDKTNPVTRGITDFELFDEVYGGFYVKPGVTSLLTTRSSRQFTRDWVVT